MNIEVRAESLKEFDAWITSRLASESFDKRAPELSADRFSWAYRFGYEHVTIIAAFSEGTKIGQLVCFSKTTRLSGEPLQVAELVDLFVSPVFRGLKVAGKLYEKMRETLEGEGTKIFYTYANERASSLNRRYLCMEETTPLPIFLGFHINRLSFKRSDIKVDKNIDQIVETCIGRYNPTSENGLKITKEQLARRISSPIFKYICAYNGEVAILGSPRVIRSVPILLVCATFTTLHPPPDKKTVRALMAALCRATERNIFLYAGWNDAFNFQQGVRVPNRLLKGKLIIQSNWINSRRKDFRRFELIDIDYA